MRRSILHLLKNLKKRKILRYLIVPLGILTLLLILFSVYTIIYSGKIYPNITVAGISVGGMTTREASNTLPQKVSIPEKIRLTIQSQSSEINTKDIGLAYNFTETANRVYNYTRTGNVFFDFVNRINLLIHPKNFALVAGFDEEALSKLISVIAGQFSVDPTYPSVKITNGKVEISIGAPGTETDRTMLRALIGQNLSYTSNADIVIPVNSIDPRLNAIEAEEYERRAKKFVGKKLEARFEYNTITYSDSEIVKLLDPKGRYNTPLLNDIFIKVSSQVNRDAQNPKFEFNGGRVSEFQPALDAIKIDKDRFMSDFSTNLDNLAVSSEKNISFDIPVTRTPPDVSTGQVNNFGIKELIGRGTSTYFHSIPSRVHNVILGASKINGTLVKPGATFSFNETLGDVSQFTGYQQAYIISEGKTILGDGGGVCQVSSTLFRAILNAGLPITERQAHAYRVGYYEQGSSPGFDATVYSPSPDLKFKNDTPNYILIQATADAKHYSLIFELYGTSDGRVATVSKPVVSNIIPALPMVYQDDPTLPAGTLKQVDYSAAGAKVTFNYTVSRGGETVYKKTFISNYRPWAAVYLRGTGPVQ